MKALAAGLSIIALAACARPVTAPVRMASVARPIARPRVRIVVSDAKSVQDFWNATITRPRRIVAVRGSIRAIAVYPHLAPHQAHLRVSDGGRALLDVLVADVPIAWQFAVLEGHRPVVLFDGFTGGAHCCFDTTIVPLASAARRTTHVDWGDLGETLMRSASGSGDVFRTGDDEMAYAFSSFAASTFAVKVLAYRGGRMRDVTGEYPALIERDARDQWLTYLKRRHDPDLTVQADLYPPLVSYLADEYRLGRGSAAWARVRAANGPAHAFYTKALLWLRSHGYVT